MCGFVVVHEESQLKKISYWDGGAYSSAERLGKACQEGHLPDSSHWKVVFERGRSGDIPGRA
jgi:hypothetical protein